MRRPRSFALLALILVVVVPVVAGCVREESPGATVPEGAESSKLPTGGATSGDDAKLPIARVNGSVPTPSDQGAKPPGDVALPDGPIPRPGDDALPDGPIPRGAVEVHVAPMTLDVESINAPGGNGTLPVYGLMSTSGEVMHVVGGTLALVADEEEEAAFLGRYAVEVMERLPLAEAGGASKESLLRLRVLDLDAPIRNEAVDLSSGDLASRLEALAPGVHASLQASHEDALRLVWIAAAGAMEGYTVGLDFVTKGAAIADGSTREAPDASGVGADPFTWPYMVEGGTMDIGVTAAWQELHRAGRLDARVPIAILDRGFLRTADLPAGADAYCILPACIGDPFGLPDPIPCSTGGDCSWHGTMTSSTAMARVDNLYGTAGVAGPVGVPVLAHGYHDFVTIAFALHGARERGANIASMSFGAPIDAILTWAVAPTDIATWGQRASGMLLFASSGNNGVDVDDIDCAPISNWPCWESQWWYPCENSGVMCVGGLAWDSQTRDGSSNYGSAGSVRMFAPFDVFVGPTGSPLGPNALSMASGTSFSSPFVAGVAALVWAADPTLAADEVERTLVTTAHLSPDPQVGRYVDAHEAVRSALAGAPLELEIVSPEAGARSPGGAQLLFRATWTTPGNIASLEWRSDRDGVIGTTGAFWTRGLSTGHHVITVTGTNDRGERASDVVEIDITNDAPRVWIDSPRASDVIYAGQQITLTGRSFDRNMVADRLQLRPSQMVWTIDGIAGQVGIGSIVDARLPEGRHTLRLTGTDDGGLSSTATVDIVVLPPPASPLPTLRIVVPSSGSSYDATEGSSEPYHRTVTLLAELRDHAGGPYPADWTIRWIDDMGAGPQEIARGWRAEVQLSSLYCASATHRITADVTGPAGERIQQSVVVHIRSYVPC